MLSEDMTLKDIQTYFSGDRFATQAAGCCVIEASKGHSVCEMVLTPIHYNAHGGVMGGAIFTLADFALAVACNIGEKPTVSVSNTIEFMSSVKGEKLIAECNTNKSGNTLGFYTVDVKDDTGRAIAHMTATCCRR